MWKCKLQKFTIIKGKQKRIQWPGRVGEKHKIYAVAFNGHLFYRPQMKSGGKVICLQACVCPQGGGAWSRGVCMVCGGGAWSRGWGAWSQGVHGPEGVVHGPGGAW